MLHFVCKPFEQLSLQELYDCLAARQAVFIVEQDCPYLDADGLDPAAWHLLGRSSQGTLAAYARLLPPGTSYPDYASIGRVLTTAAFRGKGAGKELMQQALTHTRRLWPHAPIKLSAQRYLTAFYQSFGFSPVGEPYLEDGIPHIAMVLPAPTDETLRRSGTV